MLPFRKQNNAYIKSNALMTTMEPLSIRTLTEKDIEFAYELNTTEQWNDRKEDLLRMYNYEPKGCFIAELQKKPIGHIFSVSYGKLGWIGLLIVKTEHRRKGTATQLMKRAVDYLLQCGVETIKLEAVPEMAELYRKLGFIDECDSLRFSKTLAKPDLQAKDGPAPIKKENISEIAEFDEKFFGANRTKVLASLFKENTQLCLAAYDREAVDGYIMCRKAKNGFKIGPFVCNPENTQTADDLLQALANRLVSTTLYVGLPATNKNAVDLLTKRGFTRYSMSIRMRLGQELKNERVQGVFGIGGPMKG
jgi:predicted N-acetyltransferase YhbS